MILYVVRHGDPIYSPDSLTEKGKRQAEALGRRFSVHGLDKIYSSPMNRAQMTAQPTAELLGKKIEILDWTSEDLAGQYMGFTDPLTGNWSWTFGINPTRYKTEENLAMEHWYDAFPFNQSKAKEGFDLIAKESDAFLETLGYKREGLKYKILNPSDEKVAVFCHYGFGTTWLSHLLGMNPISFMSTFDMNHSGVTILHFANHSDGYTAPKVLAFSDISHYYGDRLPMQFTNYIDI